MLQKDKQFLDQFRLIVLETITDSTYSIDYICRSLYISRSQLHRKIKKATGLSCTIYIRKIRIDHSAELLRNTSLKISHIANIVGINSAQNFSKYFRQEFGVSPSDFKKLSI